MLTWIGGTELRGQTETLPLSVRFDKGAKAIQRRGKRSPSWYWRRGLRGGMRMGPAGRGRRPWGPTGGGGQGSPSSYVEETGVAGVTSSGGGVGGETCLPSSTPGRPPAPVPPGQDCPKCTRACPFSRPRDGEPAETPGISDLPLIYWLN